jgi:hypothetical protein
MEYQKNNVEQLLVSSILSSSEPLLSVNPSPTDSAIASGVHVASDSAGYDGSLATNWNQPNTWPKLPREWNPSFIATFIKIFHESILDEIKNVIEDAQKRNGSLEHRGHVVGVALLCALDAISSYGYGARSGAQIPEFIKAHFPSEYHPYARDIKVIYRNCLVHSWNLFGVALTPGKDPISKNNGILSVGILHLNESLALSTSEFLHALETNKSLQSLALERYSYLINSHR